MTKKYKVLGKYIKDMSSETPNIETYLFVRDNLSKYQLGIDITSNPLKNKHIEVNTTLKFEDKNQSKLKSHFEIIFATIIKVDEDLEDKKELEKIILCDVQNEVYSFFEKSLLDLLHNSGYPGIKFEKKVDFDSLYKQKFN
jgi:preprotein translocase subunit SecB